jgi:methylisocitrate lyase
MSSGRNMTWERPLWQTLALWMLPTLVMVRRFEEAGAAAIHLEDQILPKKRGHLSDKRLASPQDMAAKIAAAVRARRDLVVIARTDAVANEGLEAAITRAKLYLQAGADAIFPEALTDVAMLRAFAEALPGVPLLANMTEFGRTPRLTGSELQELGYKMVIWPVSSLRVANKAQERLYATIRDQDTTEPMLTEMQTRAELYDTIGYFDFEKLDSSISASVLLS